MGRHHKPVLSGTLLLKILVRLGYFVVDNSLIFVLAYVKPYLLNIQPIGSISAASLDPSISVPKGPTGFAQSPVLQVQSSLTLQHVQYIVLPSTVQTPSTLRLLTTYPGAKAPVFVVSTPQDRTAAAAEGSSIWLFYMRPWGEQVDELVEEEKYDDALALLESIDEATLSDKVCRFQTLR